MTRELLVLGPPGTGKTTYLARQARQAAAQVGEDNVIIASFTRTAAAEIAGRDTGVPRDHVGTLHALCYRALGKPPVAETKAKEWNEEAPEYALTEGRRGDVDDPYADDAPDDDDPAGNELLAEYSRLRALMMAPAFWPLHVRAFAEKWEAWKQRTGYIDFTDMIALALEEVPVAPGSPAVGFFDETQDFSRLELSLIRRWAEHMDYAVLAGDDDQALYRFKGATPDAFVNPDVPDTDKRVLTQSFRVPRAVHAVAAEWVEGIAIREPKEYLPRDADGAVEASRATFKRPDAIIDEIEEVIAAGETAMVIASCSYMLRATIGALREAGIPFHNPYRTKRGDWNPLGRTNGISTVERLLAYLHPDPRVWGEAAQDWTRDDVGRFGQMLRAEGILQRGAKTEFGTLRGHIPVEPHDLARWFSREALPDLLDLDPLWLVHHVTKQFADKLGFPLDVLRTRGGEALRERPRVVVGTIHSVKGGEADHVFVFPDLSNAGYAEWLDNGDGHDTVRRVFYVAMTRARERLVLCGRATNLAVDLEAAW